ncbi:hypothetical protein HKX02_24885 [Ochrobactrum soli]|uniref:Uncharacterized protein n=1 Tax=Ochrobactrum soli TaxID=2448455 RepID=A0A849KWI5_9HYPH|nr:hypothetical protein [[Ochrobactrum] soli]
MKRFKSARHLQRFASIHGPIYTFINFHATTSPLLSTANYAKQPMLSGAISRACNLTNHNIIDKHASGRKVKVTLTAL